MGLQSFEPEIISRKSDPQLSEQWLQDRIADNLKILGANSSVAKITRFCRQFE